MLIGLGSNKSWLGRSPQKIIESASDAMNSLGRNVKLSPLYSSPAWPDPNEPTYVNAVVLMESAHAPAALLSGLHAIEAALGRLRSERPELRYAPRTLDCDLLAVGTVIEEGEALTVPHPRIAERDFVLLPLRDVAPDWIDPRTGASVDELIGNLSSITAKRL